MNSDSFEMPDMDDLARQMQEAMDEAQQAMEDLPGQMDSVLGGLSALMGDLPTQMQDLNAAMSGFGEMHKANAQALIGEPDWNLEATIKVGEILHLVVVAAFDLEKVVQTWESTQGDGLESLLSGLMGSMGGDDMEAGTMDQVMGQLEKGRGMAAIQRVDVLACHIAGSPANASETLQLSPEANIPLVLHEGSLGFEFAPMLTIRNKWEHATIPVFSPMGEDVVVDLARFDRQEPFSVRLAPQGQEHKVSIELSLTPIA